MYPNLYRKHQKDYSTQCNVILHPTFQIDSFFSVHQETHMCIYNIAKTYIISPCCYNTLFQRHICAIILSFLYIILNALTCAAMLQIKHSNCMLKTGGQLYPMEESVQSRQERVFSMLEKQVRKLALMDPSPPKEKSPGQREQIH